MPKITLITHKSDLTSFNADHLQTILNKYFNIVYYTGKETFDPKSSVIVIGLFNKDNFWFQKLYDSGIKVMVENLWEETEQVERPWPTDILVLTNTNWCRYQEPLWFDQLGYKSYIPNKKYTHKAFMPMRLRRRHRDMLLSKLEFLLDDIIYSYVAKGIYLPNDMPHDLDTGYGNFQRYFNPEWYDSTYFSLVSESTVDHPIIFPSEKIFKPMALYHPFIVSGQPGLLNYIRNLGFETFENLFDESYDTETEFDKRLTIIVENVKQFNKQDYNKLTWEKLRHNNNLLYNTDVIEQGLIEEIFNPIIEYAET